MGTTSQQDGRRASRAAVRSGGVANEATADEDIAAEDESIPGADVCLRRMVDDTLRQGFVSPAVAQAWAAAIGGEYRTTGGMQLIEVDGQVAFAGRLMGLASGGPDRR